MLPTYMSSGIFLCIWCFGLALVQSVPLTRDESSSSESSRCQSYTHWDVSEERCVSCTEVCNAGEELKEDCGYSPTGDPIADPCRQCPSGTYSSSGQEQCQACEICPGGYQQECSPTQPAICLCKEHEELAPDGVSCQEICCYCQYDADIYDRLDDCVRRYYNTPALKNYICKKGSYSAGETCKRSPTTPPPVVTSTTTASPKTTPQQQNVTATSPTVSDSTSGSGTTPTPVHPLGPTHPATASSGSPPTEEARTTEGPSTPHPLPGPTGKQSLQYLGGVFAGCFLAILVTCFCCIRYKGKIVAYWGKPEGGEADGLLDIHDENNGEEDADSQEEEGSEGEESLDVVQSIVGDPDEDVANAGGADSGNVSTESLDAGSCKRDSTTSSKDSLLDPDSSSVSSTGDDNTQEAGGSNGHMETGDNDKKETAPKGMGSDETMEFSETIEGPANDERGVNARPSGGGPNRPHQQQQPPQPPPYPGQGQGIPAAGHQPAVSISGGTFHGPVTFIVGGHHNHPAPAAGGPPQDGNDRRGADGNANDGAGGIGRQPAPHDEDGRPAHLPGNGNDRARNRRHPVVPDIQVSILPNPARVDQNVHFSCDLPDNMDPHACEFRWMKRGQLDRVAQVQNFSKNVQRYDAGVYTCEVTTADGQVLEGQAVLEIIQDGAEGGTNESGHVRRAADHDSDQPSRKRPRTGTPDAQGFSNPSSQIQVPEFIQGKPLAEVLDHADLLHELEIKLEQPGRKHFKNIGSYFGISHDKVEHIEYRALGSNNSPFKWILEKVTTMYEDRTVGELLKYCDETLERRDVVRIVVDYFEKEEQDSRERETEVKEGVEKKSFVANSDSEQAKDCFKTDSVEIDEFKELRAVRSEADVAMDDVPEKSALNPAVAREKLGACEGSRDAIELVELQS